MLQPSQQVTTLWLGQAGWHTQFNYTLSSLPKKNGGSSLEAHGERGEEGQKNPHQSLAQHVVIIAVVDLFLLWDHAVVPKADPKYLLFQQDLLGAKLAFQLPSSLISLSLSLLSFS